MDYTAFTDETLQSLTLAGDRFAENQLAERYLRLVKSCARQFTFLGGETDDLIQEGTLGLISAIRNFDSSRGVSFQNYAAHCVKMRVLSAVESSTRKKNEPLNTGISIDLLSENQDGSSEFLNETGASPEDVLISQEFRSDIFSFISEKLSPFERKVILLYLDGYSGKEISLQTGKSIKSVNNAIQRARNKMAQTFL